MAATSSKLPFLSDAEYELLVQVLSKRNPGLLEQVGAPGHLSGDDVEALTEVLIAEEFVSNLDENWDPTDYALRVEKLADDIKSRWLRLSGKSDGF
ncbi:hypothetical protein MSTE_02000 [Mycobacteroides stephanolepidis]|uniref:Uncharacterized protein n=1 Tax=[Mycobacterium] stephanolepidis TaxID=1520670 RepID=A0A1Z4EWG1_9MYCO|nr:hypothetical protein [[Mycobacterium] stephanolepidis]BAX97316.1 hypothetical protein MSTE_02000 [[Mycobacterium] stephanolepidis]